ncbi:MAG: hypothetical protein AB7U82_12200 [Blastocatellales bacterium]
MNISCTSSKLIARLLKEFLAESAPSQLDLRRIAAEANALPLFTEMGGVYAINTHGDIISFSWDSLELPKEETDPRIRNIVLFQGSKKYPEIRCLIPEKPDDARICPHCQGTGIEPFSAKHNVDGVVCYCGGLGWIPKEDAERGASTFDSQDV